MPIDYRKYPANWKTEIRPAILKRAENRCEFCQMPNYAIYTRNTRTIWYVGKTYKSALSQYQVGPFFKEYDAICVLTIAHLDHDINNNDPDNLRALCQKCHNNHDKKYRAENRKRNKQGG